METIILKGPLMNDPQPSLSLQVFRHHKLTPRSTKIMAVINGIYSAAGGTDSVLGNREAVNAVLDEIEDYSKTSANLDYGPWAPFHMSALRSMALDAGARFGEAFEEDKRTLQIANSSGDEEDRAIAEMNCCSGARRLGLKQDAVLHGERAFALRPRNPIIMTNFGIALAQAGATDAATSIFEMLADLYRANPRHSAFGAHLKYEQELRDLQLPVIQDLLSEMGS